MNPSTIILASFALASAVTLSSCGFGSGDRPGEISFSARVDSYPCDDFYIVMDPESADAAIYRGAHDTLQCFLDSGMDKDCQFGINEFTDGRIGIAILGCEFDLAEPLFRCGFAKGEVSALNATSFAGCCFDREFCREDFRLCFRDDAKGTSCEICDNGIDEDDDGLVDCEQRSCRRDPACVLPTTTSTTASTTTTTGFPTTTTTLLSGCELVFRVVDTASIGSIEWFTDYSAAPGAFASDSGTVECESLVDGNGAAFFINEDQKTLYTLLGHPTGFEGPEDLTRCRFLATDLVQARDFAIVGLEAHAPDTTPIEPPPAVSVISLDCGPIVVP